MADNSKISSKVETPSSGLNTGDSSITPGNSIKTPTSITEQVLVGLLNDVFSSCVFRSVPKINDQPVTLGEHEGNGNKYYMLSVKWAKKNALVQSISHQFSVFDGEASFSKDDPGKYSKGSIISVGLSTALELSLKEPSDGSKIPISITKNFIDKEVNKGGYWAYMSSPVFLNANGSDDKSKEQQERRSKILKLSEEDLDIISPSVILSLLWSIYYTNSHKKLKDVCTILCYEFLENYHRYKKYLVYLLYLGQKTNVLTNDQLGKMINAKFNSVAILENLTVQDVVVLTNIVDYHQMKSSIGQKLGSILFHHVEYMSKECAVYLLTGLLKLNFPFQESDLFTKVLMSRILNVYEDIDSSDSVETLFNTMSIMPYPVLGYLNDLISKTLNRLHKLLPSDVGKIGSLYATGNITFEMLKNPDKSDEIKSILDGDINKPLSKHIYHCLEYKFRDAAINHKGKELDLLTLIHEFIIYNLKLEYPEEVNKKGFKYDHKWMDTYSAIKISEYNVKETLPDAWELEAQANNPAYSKSFTFFFLNLLDDCFKNEELLDEVLIEQIIFSFLTLKIDLSPIHEQMLISKGKSIKKAGGFVEINIVDSSERMKTQYKMAKEILNWSKEKAGKDDVLRIGGIKIDPDSFEILERDNKLPEMRKQRSVTINIPKEPAKGIPGKVIRSPPPEKKTKQDPKEIDNQSSSSSFDVDKYERVKSSNRSFDRRTKEDETKDYKKKVDDERRDKESKVIDINIKDLIKLTENLPEENFVAGNPIYEVLKSYGLEKLNYRDRIKSLKSRSGDLSGDVYIDDSKVSTTKQKGGRKSKESLNRDASKEENWINVSKESKEDTNKVVSSKKQKKASGTNRKQFDIFFKIITINKTKIRLEKREIRIRYEYVKKRR